MPGLACEDGVKWTLTSLWPRKRDRKTFDEWFSVECHTVIIDTVGSIIEDDET
jgi:hypothetical protein